MQKLITAYVAGKFSSKERIKRECERLLERGTVTIVSNWPWEPYPATMRLHQRAASDWVRQASIDVVQVQHANFFILDTLDESETGGREVEFGMFLARQWDERARMLSVRIGPARNIFHHVVDFEFASWAEFQSALKDNMSSLRLQILMKFDRMF